MYSESVEERKKAGIKSIGDILTDVNDINIKPPMAPTNPINVQTALGKSLAVTSQSDMQKSFDLVASKLLNDHPAEVAQKYPELIQWQNSRLRAI